MNEIRVGIVGVGNCAAALVQGVYYYAEDERRSGLRSTLIGPYGPGDLRFVSAFDVDEQKVGKRLDRAIWASENCTLRFVDVLVEPVTVTAGPQFDGLGRRYRERVRAVDDAGDEVVARLRETRTEVLINYLPVGSEVATHWYAAQALKAGCAFVNAIPVFLASDPAWDERFRAAGLPLVGDDIKSQFGATILHRQLLSLLALRGIRVERTYQLNFGGNMDFYNMLNDERLASKRQSKTQSAAAALPYEMAEGCIHVSPSDYVEWLGDQKVCYLRVEATAFGGAPLSLECRLQVWDSPNSAGVVIDAVRCARLALDRKEAGALVVPSAFLMKSPPVQIPDDEGALRLEQWVNGGSHAR